MECRTVGCLVIFVLGLLVAPSFTDAQLPVKVPQIGFLATGGFPHLSCRDPDFLRGVHELGYVEERNTIIEWRCAEGRTDWAHQFARELVQLGVDAIVSAGLVGSHAAKAASSTIPIILVGGGDPVVGGLVPNL